MANKFNLCFLLIINIFIINQVQCQNWCEIQDKYCSSFNTIKQHIGCNPLHIQQGQCTNIKIIPLNNEFKQIILDAHNKKRNLIASGKLFNFPSAARMKEMMWDDDLEDLAKIHVLRCNMQHDECRATENFHTAGQNLAMKGSSNKRTDDTTIVKELINNWWNEYVDAPAELVNYFDPPNNGKVIGHFTVMVNENNSHLGCALISYQTYSDSFIMYNHMLTCDYAVTNMRYQPLYTTGSPASNCKSINMTRSETYSSLCSDEKIRPPQQLTTPDETENENVTIQTEVPHLITTTTNIPNSEVNVNLNNLKLIILDGSNVPHSARTYAKQKAHEIINKCEVENHKNINHQHIRMYISPKEQDYEYYQHQKIKIALEFLTAPIILNYQLTSNVTFNYFTIYNYNEQCNVGCSYITFEMSKNVMRLIKNDPITCFYTADKNLSNGQNYCVRCKKYTLKCITERDQQETNKIKFGTVSFIPEQIKDASNDSKQIFYTNFIQIIGCFYALYLNFF